jgi:hypothetical protein
MVYKVVTLKLMVYQKITIYLEIKKKLQQDERPA